MLDSAFQLLFSYRPVVFQRGEFRLVPSTGSYVAAAIAIAAVAITFLTYRAARAKSGMGHRLVLAALRTATLLLILFCLFRPVLVMKAAVPQQNFLGILLDPATEGLITNVRIVTGSTALGPSESPTVDLVVMDDFLYGEPRLLAAAVPEPGTLALLSLVLAGFGFARLRKRR